MIYKKQREREKERDVSLSDWDRGGCYIVSCVMFIFMFTFLRISNKRKKKRNIFRAVIHLISNLDFRFLLNMNESMKARN